MTTDPVNLTAAEILSLAFDINKIREENDGPPLSTDLAKRLAPHTGGHHA